MTDNNESNTASRSEATMKAVFALDEYHEACIDFFSAATHTLMKVTDPVYGMVSTKQVSEVYDQTIETPSGPVTLGTFGGTITLEVSLNDLTSGRLECFSELVASHAQKSLDTFMPPVFERLGKLADATGQTIDAKGQKLSWDLLIDILEKSPLEFDEQGNIARGWAFLTSPKMYEAIKKLGPLSPAQEARNQAVLARKREEFNARRRNRKLS